MVLLTLTTDKLQLVNVPGSGSLDVVATYTDRNQSTGIVGLADRQLTSITGSGATDILASPGATTTRVLETLVVRNLHATTVSDVIIRFNASGSLYEFVEVRLFPNDTLLYTIESGFKKATAVPRFDAYRTLTDQSFHRIDTTQQQALPGLTIELPFSSSAKTYLLEAYVMAKSVITTTGIRPGFMASNAGVFTPSGGRVGAIGGVLNSVTGATLSAACTAAGSPLGSGPIAQTTGSTAVTPFFLFGSIAVPANSAIAISAMANSEISASGCDFYEGSWFHVQEVTG